MHINVLGLLFVILVVLNLLGHITIGWFWVFLPITLPFIILGGIALILGGFLGIALILGGITDLAILAFEKWG